MNLIDQRLFDCWPAPEANTPVLEDKQGVVSIGGMSSYQTLRQCTLKTCPIRESLSAGR